MSLFQNYFLTTIVADLLAEAVTLLCCRYIGPIPLLCKSIRGIMNKGLAPSLNSVGMFLRAKIFRLYQGFVIKGINHTGQIFLNRPSVSSCVRHGCNPLERFSSDWGDLSEQGSVMRGLTILHKSLIKSLRYTSNSNDIKRKANVLYAYIHILYRCTCIKESLTRDF
jgi:hypothetical protein